VVAGNLAGSHSVPYSCKSVSREKSLRNRRIAASEVLSARFLCFFPGGGTIRQLCIVAQMLFVYFLYELKDEKKR
jgi:hypothetical protein